MNSEKEEKVYKVFQTISRGYDDANRRISLGREQLWKKQLISLFDEFEYSIDDPEEKGNTVSILDVCCGTGDISLAIKRNHPKYDITGLDFSPAMLDVAREKMDAEFPDALIPPVTWIKGNAMVLPYPDNYFNGTCISFGLRNTPDYRQVLSEMLRVTRPGGIIACLDSFVPENGFVRFFYNIYFKGIMPFIGGQRENREEYSWLANSTEEFLRASELKALFSETGIQGVRLKSMMCGACCLHWGRK